MSTPEENRATRSRTSWMPPTAGGKSGVISRTRGATPLLATEAIQPEPEGEDRPKHGGRVGCRRLVPSHGRSDGAAIEPPLRKRPALGELAIEQRGERA